MWVRISRGYLSGALDGCVRREGVRVFNYHGLVEAKNDARLERNFNITSDFRSHIRFLKKFRILSLAEFNDELSGSARKSSKPAAVLTFDDGYANNLQVAEILTPLRLPWFLFVSTGVVGRAKLLWTVELSLLILHGRADRIEALGKTWSLASRKEREFAFEGIRYPLKSMAAAQKCATMDLIATQFPAGESPRLLKKFPSFEMLTWDEIKQLSSAGVEIGSHGVDHEIHHPNQPAGVRRRELRESKSELETRLGRPCYTFALPNGDFNSLSAAEIREAGYRVAFTTQPGTATLTSNRYLLPRLATAPSLSRFAYHFFWEKQRAPK